MQLKKLVGIAVVAGLIGQDRNSCSPFQPWRGLRYVWAAYSQPYR
jgi:hypothetical protein